MSNVDHVVARFLNRVASMPQAKVDQKTKMAVVRAMKLKGLDGNGRFEKPERGYAEALGILNNFGIEMDEVVNSFKFKPDSNIQVSPSRRTTGFIGQPP